MRVAEARDLKPGDDKVRGYDRPVMTNAGRVLPEHLYLLNRGFMLTPFHNMMLTSPVTTAAQVDAFLAVFDGALVVLGERLRRARVGKT